MFLFLTRWLKTLILGWVAAMAMYLIKRMLQNIFKMDRPPQWPESSSQADTFQSTRHQHDANIIDTLYSGMSGEQLSASLGAPLSKQTHQGGIQIWIYKDKNITLQDNKVTSWESNQAP